MLFRKMLGSKEDFSWDTVAQNDAIGKLVGGYLNEMLMSDEQKEARAADEQKRQQEQARNVQGFNLMNMVENTIGGFFTNIGKDLKALASDVGNAASGVKSAWGSIQSGEAWENIKTGAASAWEGIKGAASWVKDTAASAWNGVKNVAASAWNSVAGAVSTAVGAVGTFAEKTGNWFTGDGFNTDDQVEEIRAKERIQEAIKNGTALEEGSAEYMRMMKELEKIPGVKVGSSGQISKAEYMQRFREMDEKLNGSEKGVDIRRLSQEELDQQLNGKGACKIISFLTLAEKRMRDQGLDVSGFDVIEIYENAKQKGDAVIKDRFWVTNPTELVKTAGVKGDISWGNETDQSKFSSTIIQQIDKGNPVMMILDDQHASIIYDYEKKNDNLRLLVHDVGYQKDTYLNSKTWQPYQGNEKYSTQKGVLPMFGGKPRSVTKLLYLK